MSKIQIKITVFDGATCIGGSKIHLLDGETGIFLDFGINYKKWGNYYEEYLKPRPAVGILDLLNLKLVPPIAELYRKDLLPPNTPLPEFPFKAKTDGLFITHAHLDHCGHLGLVNPDIPVYASAMTAVLMKAIQDSGQLDFDREMAYINPRGTSRHPEILETGHWKKIPYQGRKLHVVDEEIKEGVQEFWLTPPNPTGRGRRLDAGPLTLGSGIVGDLTYRAFPLDHSIFGATAYAFQTSQGWIVYTGDLRLHGTRSHLTKRFIEAAAELQPLALIVEGTNVGREPGVSEDEAQANCLKKIQASEGKLVVADFSPRNIERLIAFLQIAKETDRKLVILAKDAYLLQAMRLVDQEIPDILADEALCILEERKVSPSPWEKDYIQERYEQKYLSANQLNAHQGEYILSLSFWDIKHLLDITPEKGGIYLYSTSEAYTEEQEIDVRRLWNWLQALNLKPIGFRLPDSSQGAENPKPVFEKKYHASGHISGEELIEVIQRIRPEYVIPVHTERPQYFVEHLGEEFQIIQPEEGKAILL